MLILQQRAWVLLALLLVAGGAPTTVGEPQSGLLNPVVEGVAGLLPIPGALLGALAPKTSLLTGLVQSALLQNNLTQFSSDIVTAISSVVADVVNADLPVPPYLRPDEEARKFGFVGEAYNVTTSDGYILGVFRVRNGTCGSYRAVVVIPPAILSNAGSFIFLKENSLVYRLARRCFDVWLITFRGALFGRGHIRLSDTSAEFWDFYTYHWGAIDLPLQLEFVSNKTNSTRLRYMCADQGFTVLLFMNHVHRQRYQRLLASVYCLAPIGYLGRLESLPFAALAVVRDGLVATGALVLHNELAFMNPVVHSVLYNLCGRISPITCYYLFQLLAGKTTEINYTIFPYAFANLLDSTSIDVVTYYLQQVGKIKYMKFLDYGRDENLRRYNRTTPENVDISATTVPCSLYALGNDTVTVTLDVADTFYALNESAQSVLSVLGGYNGVSTLFARDTERIYEIPIRQLEVDLIRFP